MISKIKLKCFQINLMLELFICLILEWLEFSLKNHYIRVTFFFEICDIKFLVIFFVVYIFS